MAKKSRTSIGLGIVGICFFSVCLLCLVSLFFFLPNSLSVSYACGLITPVQRGNSSEEHFFNSDFTIILFSIYFSFFFLLVLRDVKTA